MGALATVTNKTAKFFADMTAQYAQETKASTFPILTPDEVSKCSVAWSAQVKSSTSWSLKMAPVTVNALLQDTNFPGSPEFQSATLAKQRYCSSQTIKSWIDALNAGQNCTQAATTSMAKV